MESTIRSWFMYCSVLSGKMVFKCCVPNCGKSNGIVKLHRFPYPDQELYKRWINLIGRQDLMDKDPVKVHRNYRVCHDHFADDVKIDATKYFSQTQLTKGACPIKLVPNSEEMKMFADNYKPPQKYTKDDAMTDLTEEPQKPQSEPLVFTISDITAEEVELNLRDVDPKQETIADEKPPQIEGPPEVEKPPEPEPSKPCFKSVKIYLTHDKLLSEVCRICFCAIQSDQLVKLYDDIDDLEDETNEAQKLRDMLKLVLPELDLEVYHKSVICKRCKELLVSSFELRTAWLSTEDKLRRIIENEKSIANKRNASLVLIAGTSKPKKIPEKIGPPDHNYARKPEPGMDVENPPFHFNVKIHKRELVDKGPFLCEQCGLILSNRGSLKTHLFRHEKKIEKQEEEQRQSMCEACGLIFDTLLEMKKHYAKKHKKQTKAQIKPTRFQCEICDKVLFSKTSLHKHIRHVHLRIYNYAQCHRCGKKLTSKGALRAHLMQHDAERRYHCDECGKSFFWMRSLRKHLLRHTNVKLACEYCGKKVKYEWTLKRHIQIFHMNEGNTNCEFCGKPYWKKYDLIRHKIRVHNWVSEMNEASNETSNEAE